MTSGLLSVSLAPVVGREHTWTLTNDNGDPVSDGLVPVDLSGWWDDQADCVLPKGWERYGNWDVRGDVAVAPVRMVKRAAPKRVDASFKQQRAALRRDTESALVMLFDQMKPDVAARYDAGAKRLIAQRWVDAIADAAEERHMDAAEVIGGKLAGELGFDDFNPEVMRAWLRKNAEFIADGVTSSAEDDIRAAADNTADDDEDADPVGHVFGILATSGAASLAVSMTTSAANFAVRDTAEKSGAALKVWQVTSGNPRPSHAAMNGETVAMSEPFSNGLMWPGDPEAGDASEVAECQCALTIVT